MNYITCYFVQVIRGSEILEVLHGLPDVKQYLFSMYNCQYGDFFLALGKIASVWDNDRGIPHL